MTMIHDDGLMYASRYEHVITLLTDLFWFLLNSVYFLCESLWLTVLPARFRKLKVRTTVHTKPLPPTACLQHNRDALGSASAILLIHAWC